MAALLLRSKLYIPPVRPELVSRPRLVERLNAGLQNKLTLVSAPAGFGKTTLLSEWIASHGTGASSGSGPARDGPPAAIRFSWLSLDEGDNDPFRFWSYVIAALQSAQPELGESALGLLHSPGLAQAGTPPPVEAVLTSLINEITEFERHLVLVLDDYHLIDARPIHEGLTFLLDHLPPPSDGLHLVLASRSDPPLPLSRLRGRGQLNELRTADLRFTTGEAAAFVNEAMGLALSAPDVATLEARTEGWIAGLQMAALALQPTVFRKRTTAAPEGDPGRVARFVAAFGGSHRYVLDYLTEEVLSQQPEEIQAFLLQTAILDRLTGPLCDAVIGGIPTLEADGAGPGAEDAEPLSPICRPSPNSQSLLARLEGANLFLIPLDQERRWYRYHQLFADLLRKRLVGQVGAQGLASLHLRASEWYENNGLVAEAAGHALQAGDVERLEHLVARNALVMIFQGELRTVMSWLERLPDELLWSRPWLCVAYAWVLLYAGQLAAMEVRLRDAERALAELESQTGAAAQVELEGAATAARVRGHVATMRAYAALLHGHAAHATELARQALVHLPGDDLVARAQAAGHLATALRETGALAASAAASAEAISLAQAAGEMHVAAEVLVTLAGTQLLQGKLHDVLESCREALRLADDYRRKSGRWLPGTGFAYARMTTVLQEWNDLESALAYAREGVRFSERWGQAEILSGAYIRLARALGALGDTPGMLQALDRAKQAVRDAAPPQRAAVEGLEVQLRLMRGDVAAAARWVQDRSMRADDEIGYQQAPNYSVLARLLIAQGRQDEALALLARCLEVIEAVGARLYGIKIRVLQALALQAHGKGTQAQAVMKEILNLAEPEGYVRTFLDEGEPMGELLRGAIACGTAVGYAGRLLAALEREALDTGLPGLPPSVAGRPPSSDPDRAGGLVEPLSERELEVLRLIAAGLSNREIADALYLSINTVKTHARTLYGKLGVHSRVQVVNQAEELGLL